MYKRAITLLITTSFLLLLTSCNCGAPLKVTSIQKSDKQLACKDIILEINEAEHYRDQAVESGGVGIGKMFTPTCWVSDYVDSHQAVKAANARIDYLGHIYDLLDCAGESAKKHAPPPQSSAPQMRAPTPSPAQPPVIVVPTPQAVAPMQAPYVAAPQGQFPPNSYTQQQNIRRTPGEQYKPPASTDKPVYRRIPIDEALGDGWLHEHTDANGKIYQHSHPHRGPHRHGEDLPVGN